MPRAFSDHEKETIREQMHNQARKLFELHGLRKTTVEEIASTAGISKGAFYIFYDSKEELYLQILERIEQDIQSSIMEIAVLPNENTHENIKSLLRSFLLTMDAYPILKKINQAEIDYLVRKIPTERVLQHINNDEEFTRRFITKIMSEGIQVSASPRIVANLIKSLFFVSLYREDIGEEEYNELGDVLINLVAGHISGKFQ